MAAVCEVQLVTQHGRFVPDGDEGEPPISKKISKQSCQRRTRAAASSADGLVPRGMVSCPELVDTGQLQAMREESELEAELELEEAGLHTLWSSTGRRSVLGDRAFSPVMAASWLSTSPTQLRRERASAGYGRQWQPHRQTLNAGTCVRMSLSSSYALDAGTCVQRYLRE